MPVRTLHFGLVLSMILPACEKAAPPGPVPPTSKGGEVPTVPSEAVQAPAPPVAPAPEPQGQAAPAGKLRADSQCAVICTRSTELGCLQAPVCEAYCGNSTAQEKCPDEVQKATDCMNREPIQNWECSPEGIAAIKGGFCEAEKAKVASCVAGSKTTQGAAP